MGPHSNFKPLLPFEMIAMAGALDMILEPIGIIFRPSALDSQYNDWFAYSTLLINE